MGMLVAHFVTGGVQRVHLVIYSEFVAVARTLIENALSEGKIAVVMKDLSWLWRTAYNCAVQGCTEWENFEDQVTDLFEIAQQVNPYSNGSKQWTTTHFHLAPQSLL